MLKEEMKEIFSELDDEIKMAFVREFSQNVIINSDENELKKMMSEYGITLFDLLDLYTANKNNNYYDTYIGYSFEYKLYTFDDIDEWLEKIDPEFFDTFEDEDMYQDGIDFIEEYDC